MKKYISFILLACLLVPAFAMSEEHGRGRGPGFEHEMKERELELREREWEIEFRTRMQNLELEERGIELEEQRIELEEQRVEVDRQRKDVERGPDKRCGKGLCCGGQKKCGPSKSSPCGWKRSGNAGAAHCFLFVFTCLVTHILMAVWIYIDGRKRNTANGLWIVITLFVGFFGILPYTIIRLGDLKKS